MINLISDTKNLSSKLEKVLVDEVYQGLKESNHNFNFDIDIGTIHLYVDEQDMTFKFTPSEELVQRLNSKMSKNR